MVYWGILVDEVIVGQLVINNKKTPLFCMYDDC